MTEFGNSALPERFWQKVSINAAGCWLWTAAKKAGAHDYGLYQHQGKLQSAHRVAFMELVREIPAGLVVDHVCHVPSCVNPLHLQIVSQKANLENRKGPDRDSASGVRGVYWYPSKGKWAAQAIHNGRRHHGGYFSSKDEAARAVLSLRNRLFTNNLVDQGAAVG